MIYTPLTIRALNFAYYAHQGQTDHSGLPYIFHPYHLAEQMEDEISCAAALLHDVVEHTAVTLEQLQLEFPREIVEAVDLLTHRDEVDYFDYVRALKANSVARRVKLADLIHNSDLSRLHTEQFSPEQMQARREQYMKALEILK